MTRLPAAIVFAALLSVPACGEESAMRPPIQEVKRKHEAELMAVEGVVSVGIGRDRDGQAEIIVGVDRERPEMRRLPERLEGYAVHTEVVGRIGTQ